MHRGEHPASKVTHRELVQPGLPDKCLGALHVMVHAPLGQALAVSAAHKAGPGSALEPPVPVTLSLRTCKQVLSLTKLPAVAIMSIRVKGTGLRPVTWAETPLTCLTARPLMGQWMFAGCEVISQPRQRT